MRDPTHDGSMFEFEQTRDRESIVVVAGDVLTAVQGIRPNRHHHGVQP